MVNAIGERGGTGGGPGCAVGHDVVGKGAAFQVQGREQSGVVVALPREVWLQSTKTTRSPSMQILSLRISPCTRLIPSSSQRDSAAMSCGAALSSHFSEHSCNSRKAVRSGPHSRPGQRARVRGVGEKTFGASICERLATAVSRRSISPGRQFTP